MSYAFQIRDEDKELKEKLESSRKVWKSTAKASVEEPEVRRFLGWRTFRTL
jgi:hypothetical protein